MAGLEIAGVVLGSIPLIISALEHYSDGVTTIRSMQKYESEFESLHASFVISLSIYRNSLEELLSALALSDAQLRQLLDESDSQAWDNPDLVYKLRDRLASSYLPFKSSVKQLHKKVNLFGRKLQLDARLKPSWVADDGQINIQARDSFFRNPLNRIRGGFKAERHKQLLSSLQDDINRIVTLTSGAITLEPLRLNRKRVSNSAYWDRCQRYAERLYESLSSRWSVQCTCQCRHEANLRLPPYKTEDASATTFSLLFSIKAGHGTSNLPWDWRAVEVEPTEDVNGLAPQHPNMPPKIIVHPPSAIFSSWTHCLQAASKIDDLCEALRSSQQTKPCMGVLDDAAMGHHMHLALRPACPTSLQKRTTLQELLDTHNGATFPIKEKCTIALTLANAVLQLHDTPWLEDTWNTNDIFMLAHGTSTSAVEEPYVSRSFASCGKTGVPGKRNVFIRNATIFALGVALLEISHGRRLATFQTPEDLDENGNRTTMTDSSIAYRLVENIHNRELPNFANAARRCVHCNFDGAVYSLKDDDFRERFHQGVVLPLRQDYDYATTTT